MRISLLTCFLICLFLFQSATGQHPYHSVQNPEVDDFAPMVQFLSSPELEGRMTGENGNKIAALYIASTMQQLRLNPLIRSDWKSTGVSDFFQEFTLDKINRLNTFIVFSGSNTSESDTFEIFKDFFAAPFYADFEITGMPYVSFINEQHLFIGSQKQADQTISDDKKGLKKQKKIHFASIVVDSDQQGSMDTVSKKIDKDAMKAVIIVRTEAGKEDEWYMTKDSDPEFYQSMPGPDPLVKTFYFTKEASQKIIDQYIGDSISVKPMFYRDPIKGVQIFVRGDTSSEPVTARNVIGILEGKDTSKSIIIGAHYDHLGMDGNRIFCGADDNASGVAGVLSLAKMWQESGEKPPFNLIFACWAAEETGKLGSGYYAENLANPENLLLYINMDMISRSAPEDTLGRILSIGSRTRDKHLRQLCLDSNNSLSQPFDLDLWEVDGYTGSDYAPFVKMQVPVLSFFSGYHPDYHTPEDTFERIDPEKMQSVLQLVNEILKAFMVK